MFDIAWSELLLIAVLALIFIGPKELPHVLNNLGRMTAKLRRSADEFRRHFEESMREAGYEDLHKNIQDFRSLNPANQLKASIDRAINQEYSPNSIPAAEATASLPAENENRSNGTAVENAANEAAPNGTFHANVEPDHAGAEGAIRTINDAAIGEQSQLPVDEPVKDRAAPIA